MLKLSAQLLRALSDAGGELGTELHLVALMPRLTVLQGA